MRWLLDSGESAIRRFQPGEGPSPWLWNLRKPSNNIRFNLYCGDRQNVECGKIQKLNYQLDVVIRGSSHLLGRLLGPGVHIAHSHVSCLWFVSEIGEIISLSLSLFTANFGQKEVFFKWNIRSGCKTSFRGCLFLANHNTHPCLAPDV